MNSTFKTSNLKRLEHPSLKHHLISWKNRNNQTNTIAIVINDNPIHKRTFLLWNLIVTGYEKTSWTFGDSVHEIIRETSVVFCLANEENKLIVSCIGKMFQSEKEWVPDQHLWTTYRKQKKQGYFSFQKSTNKR